jgi:hypothetical protein
MDSMFHGKVQSQNNCERLTPDLLAEYSSRMDSEEHFRTMLIMEQKRAQRYNTPCMLMLIDAALLFQCRKFRKIFRKLMSAIDESTRETDIKGWYDINRIIGIIFTEFEIETVELIVNKVKTSLAEAIPSDLSLVQVSYLIFPEDQKHGDFIASLEDDEAPSSEQSAWVCAQ